MIEILSVILKSKSRSEFIYYHFFCFAFSPDDLQTDDKTTKQRKESMEIVTVDAESGKRLEPVNPAAKGAPSKPVVLIKTGFEGLPNTSNQKNK